jgi:hypothetical protein
MKKFLSAIFLFSLLSNAYGQETLPIEREREIRTSDRYYYGECSAFSEEEAMECAIKELTQKVIVDMVRQAVGSDEAKMKNVVEVRAETAILSQIGRTIILAWIEKDSISVVDSVPALSDISNPVARELATCTTLVEFRRMANGFRRQGRLVYGENKASFVNPNNCLVAVFSREQRLIALLDTGQGARKELLTGDTIQNAEQHFAGNNLFWIQINK